MTTPVNRSTVPLLAYDPIFDRTKCLDYDGYFWAAIDYGLIYGVNGLPIPTPFTEIRRVPMAFFMCFMKSSELRKKLDRRLSIMLIVNHSVTVTYFIFNQLANSLIVVTWPVYYFLIMKLPLFLLNQAISCIVIAFYLERKRKGVISVGAISSARIR
ncbi:unnamed protein product, partial [Mesorhabditis belari]|uniref:Uncharacterized protein n=1 Tax=Mesorhabditis belari TaxID=2138241 RepID=A0AAF3EKJ6_9BILA